MFLRDPRLERFIMAVQNNVTRDSIKNTKIPATQKSEMSFSLAFHDWKRSVFQQFQWFCFFQIIQASIQNFKRAYESLCLQSRPLAPAAAAPVEASPGW
jgi:hypothetical protein